MNMADANKVLEGSLKYRDGKKWKPRWCVLQRLSPVADCLHVFLYKEHSECLKVPSKFTVVLEDFFGLQYGFTFDKENHVLSIICRNRVVNFAFPVQETLDRWKLTILQLLGGSKSFEANLIKVPQSVKVTPGPVAVYIHHSSICLVSPCSNGSLPRYLASWRIGELRRFGILGDRFCFELEEKNVGGVFLLETSLLSELNHVIDNIAHGRNVDSPLLPPKPARIEMEPAVQKPRLGSPVYKATSLDRSSLHRSESGQFETECTTADRNGSSLRRQLSEPREFPASTEAVGNKEDRAGCYHNIWCCNEAPDKANVAESQRLLCEKLITGCLEITDKVTSNVAKTGSLSKICCLPEGGCCGLSCSCSRKSSTYINLLSHEPKQQLRHCSSVCERWPAGARNTVRCASSDMLRHRAGEEARFLLPNDCSDYVNDGADADQTRRVALARRASDDPASAKEPLKPLPYVDLRRFDGDAREGYLYHMKAAQAASRESCAVAARQSMTLARPSMYANLPMPRHFGESENTPVTSAAAPKPVGGRSSYHSSLKRPNRFSIPPKALLSFVPPPPSAGSYADLRHDASSVSMLRSSSYYNVQMNTVIPPPPRRSDPKEEPLPTPRKLPQTPSNPSFCGNRYVAAEILDVVVPCKSGCRKSENRPEVEYVAMNGRSDPDDSAIFFTVNLPMRRDNLQQAELNRHNSRYSSTEPVAAGSSRIAAPAVAENGDAVGYVDMSGIAAVDTMPVNSDERAKISDRRPPLPGFGNRPKLRHSRSLENELDSPPKADEPWNTLTRRTSHGTVQTNEGRHRSPEPLKNPRDSDYIAMANITAGKTTSGSGQTLPNPFADLISHARYKLPTSPSEPNQFSGHECEGAEKSDWARRDVGSFASDPAINYLSERSNSLKSTKSFRLFARFLRRHSSAKEKSASTNVLRLSSGAPSKAFARGEPFPSSMVDVQCAPYSDAELQILSSKSSSKADEFSNCSCSSSLERLGPPPPVPECQPRDRTPEKAAGDEHYINLTSISSKAVVSLLPSSDSSSDYLNIAPPPLPPKGVFTPKNQDADPLHRIVTVAPSDKVLQVEKQPLRSITEDEHEVPPLPEKVRVRCPSRAFPGDAVLPAGGSGVDVNPKPPVPPRSVPSTNIATTSITSTQRSPRVPNFPIGMEGKSRKPNLTVDIAPTFERRGSKDDTGTKAPVQLRHLSDLRQQSFRGRMVSDLSNVSISSGEEGRPSPALTTMRPRYGKEYQYVDRRRLYEEGSPFSPQRSPSVASSVFTFDNTPSVYRVGASGNCSSGENSPKYQPGIRSRIDFMPSSRNVSPIVLDPMVDSPPASEARQTLNYADIDLTLTEMTPVASSQRNSGKLDKDKTEYAFIDLVATCAASRVGRERARQREDKERMVEALSSELKDGKLGIGGRKGSAETRRTLSLVSKDQRYNVH